MDKRSETRISHNIRFFVHVHECDEDPEMVGVSVECEAVDFSRHGCQFSSESELPVGAGLNITIGIGDPFAMYLLRGEVRWVRGSGDDVFMGVMIHDAEHTDFEKWQNEFENIFG